MRKIHLCVLLVFCAPLLGLAQEDLDHKLTELLQEQDKFKEQEEALKGPIEQARLAVLRRDLERWGLPALTAGDELVEHPGHSLVYSEAHELPKWAAHIASTELITGNLARIDIFLPDPGVPGSDLFTNYWNSGYDRGLQVRKLR